MTKRAEWKQAGKAWFLRVGALEVMAEPMPWEDDGWQWRSTRRGQSPNVGSFLTLTLAQADAVRWLRATIAEMAEACPEES